MNPGNPIQGYLKAIMAHQKFFRDEEEASARQETLLSMPLKTLPVQEAARVRPTRAGPDRSGGPARSTGLADFAPVEDRGLRGSCSPMYSRYGLANGLSMRFRSEIALGHFDEAIRTAKTLFAMALHLGEHPTLIGDLVGIAIAYRAIEPLEEMLERPGCPNLYWALTTLPRPLIPVATGMEGERTMLLGRVP